MYQYYDEFSDSSKDRHQFLDWDDYYGDDGAGGPVNDGIHDYIDGSMRISPEYALIDCRVPSSGLAVELVCSEDTYVCPSLIKILDEYVGLLTSDSTLTNMTPLKLYTQILLPGTHNV